MTVEATPSLTEAAVRRLARPQSFDRGENYYAKGAVVEVVRRGNALRGRVEGSQYEPYRVQVDLDETGIANTACSCPYDHGGICKHRVAVLLTAIREPEAVDERPPVEDLLTDLDRDALYDLVVDLLGDRPELAADVERRLETRGLSPDVDASDGAVERRTPPDPETIRSHVRSILEHPDPRQMDAPDARTDMERRVGQLYDLLDEAWAFVEAGEGEDALVYLGAMAEELMGEAWLALSYDDVSIFEFLEELGAAFAEAVLTADISEATRAEWAERLERWRNELASYGVESTFAAAAHVARQEWDGDDPLGAVLARSDDEAATADQPDEFDIWEGDRPPYADELVTAWLNVLDRAERTDAYLALARETEQTKRYVTKLVAVGRDEDAVQYALEHVSTPEEALAVAKTLREHDHPEPAVRVARRGVEVEGFGTGPLAEWLRDAASALGDHETAVEGAVAAFEADPCLETYRAAKEVTGDDWPSVREELLNHLRGRQPGRASAVEHADVFLAEGMTEEAVALADASGHASVVERVTEAVREDRPQWTIRACKEQAEPIIEEGQSDRYRQAVDWLETAGRAAEAAGELDEWREYVEDLREEHYRKYKLRPMLDDLLEAF